LALALAFYTRPRHFPHWSVAIDPIMLGPSLKIKILLCWAYALGNFVEHIMGSSICGRSFFKRIFLEKEWNERENFLIF
jgi:hypothetical protein